MADTETSRRYRVTYLRKSGARVVYNAFGRQIALAPGQSKMITLRDKTAAHLGGKFLRVEDASGHYVAEAKEPETPPAKNPIAIDNLVAQAESGVIAWPDLRREANVYLDPLPASKADIIDALKARAEELRAS